MSVVLEYPGVVGPANMQNVPEISESERRIREARQATAEKYQGFLTAIVNGETFDAVEFLRLASALGRSEADTVLDIEDRTAELQDEAERQRCHDEIHRINDEIAKQQAKLGRVIAEQNKTANDWRELDATIKRIEATVAQKERVERYKLLEANQAAAALAQTTTATIEELQGQLANLRPGMNHLEQLRNGRLRAVHMQQKKASNDAMMPLVELQQMSELPPGMISKIISGGTVQGPPTYSLSSGERVDDGKPAPQLASERLADEQTKRPRVRLGLRDGQPVETVANKLG